MVSVIVKNTNGHLLSPPRRGRGRLRQRNQVEAEAGVAGQCR